MYKISLAYKKLILTFLVYFFFQKVVKVNSRTKGNNSVDKMVCKKIIINVLT